MGGGGAPRAGAGSRRRRPGGMLAALALPLPLSRSLPLSVVTSGSSTAEMLNPLSAGGAGGGRGGSVRGPLPPSPPSRVGGCSSLPELLLYRSLPALVFHVCHPSCLPLSYRSPHPAPGLLSLPRSRLPPQVSVPLSPFSPLSPPFLVFLSISLVPSFFLCLQVSPPHTLPPPPPFLSLCISSSLISAPHTPASLRLSHRPTSHRPSVSRSSPHPLSLFSVRQIRGENQRL